MTLTSFKVTAVQRESFCAHFLTNITVDLNEMGMLPQRVDLFKLMPFCVCVCVFFFCAQLTLKERTLMV